MKAKPQEDLIYEQSRSLPETELLSVAPNIKSGDGEASLSERSVLPRGCAERCRLSKLSPRSIDRIMCCWSKATHKFELVGTVSADIKC